MILFDFTVVIKIKASTCYFHKESSKSYVSIIVMQSELPSVNLLFIFSHNNKKKKTDIGLLYKKNTSFRLIAFMQFNYYFFYDVVCFNQPY